MRAPRARRHGRRNRLQRRPGGAARAFERQGFEWLHIVDLNGAFAGKPVNGAAVEAILGATAIPAQLGGGIRDLATIEMWLGKGVRRVVLGTAAVRDPALVREACRLFPGRVAVGIDARAAASRSQGGRRRASSPRSSWPAGSRMPASPHSSTPTSSATAC